jgi:hypothetical protein
LPSVAQEHPPYDPNSDYLFDGIPNFGKRATIRAVKTGNWNNTATWSPNRLPGSGDTVLIPAGVTVTYNTNATVRTVVVSGSLNFAIGESRTLTATTILIRPDGTLQIGTPASPVAAARTQKINLLPSNYTRAEDPSQQAGGILVLGRFIAQGAMKTPHVRLANAPVAGARVVYFTEPVSGWRVNDRVSFPDSRDMSSRGATANQTEIHTISAISADGMSVTLSKPLAFSHPGSVALPGEKPFAPHIQNLTRNITIASTAGTSPTLLSGFSSASNWVSTFATATPQLTIAQRGHCLVGSINAQVDLQGVAFQNMGRTTTDPLNNDTNRIGRYSLHFHHTVGTYRPMGNNYRSQVVGCAFEDSPKWLLAIHGTSRVLVQKNVFLGAKGAAVVTEDGNERDNDILGNSAFYSPGIGVSDPRARMNRDPKDFGFEGVGFWLSSGASNRVEGNIAADCGTAGIFLFPHPAHTLRYPLTADAMHCCFKELQFPQRDFSFYEVPIANNEIYSSRFGIDLWGMSGSAGFTIKNSTVWNLRGGVVLRGTRELIVDGLVARGVLTGDSYGIVNRWHPVCPDMRNLDIANFDFGIKTFTGEGRTATLRAPNISIENSRFRCRVGVEIEADMHYKKFVGPSNSFIRNCRFEGLTPTAPFTAIAPRLVFGSDIDMIAGDFLWVQNFQGRIGENYQLFYDLQAPHIIVPHSSPDKGRNNLPADQDYMIYHDGTKHFRINGLDEPGLTNTQAWAKYRKAIAGAVSPTNYRHPQIVGGFAHRISSVPALPIGLPAWNGALDSNPSWYTNATKLWGHALDTNLERPLVVDVYVDGVKIERFAVNQYRGNLRRCSGFEWIIPTQFLDGREHTFNFVSVDKGAALPGFPAKLKTLKK